MLCRFVDFHLFWRICFQQNIALIRIGKGRTLIRLQEHLAAELVKTDLAFSDGLHSPNREQVPGDLYNLPQDGYLSDHEAGFRRHPEEEDVFARPPLDEYVMCDSLLIYMCVCAQRHMSINSSQ